MKIRIYVTQKEIDEVRSRSTIIWPYNSFSCPLAISAGKMFRDSFIHIQVCKEILGYRYRKPIMLPPEASQWIEDFDNHRKIMPINFLVEI